MKGESKGQPSDSGRLLSSLSIPVGLSIASHSRSSIALVATAVSRGVSAGDAAGRTADTRQTGPDGRDRRCWAGLGAAAL